MLERFCIKPNNRIDSASFHTFNFIQLTHDSEIFCWFFFNLCALYFQLLSNETHTKIPDQIISFKYLLWSPILMLNYGVMFANIIQWAIGRMYFCTQYYIFITWNPLTNSIKSWQYMYIGLLAKISNQLKPDSRQYFPQYKFCHSYMITHYIVIDSQNNHPINMH